MASSSEEFLAKANEAFVDEDHKTALSLYTQSISLCETNEQAFSKRAFCNYVLENYEDCVSDAAHCLALNPSNSKALLRKGMGFLALEQHKLAKDSFLEGETRFPNAEPWLDWVKKCVSGDEEEECMTISSSSLLAVKAKKYVDDEPAVGWSERPIDSLASFSELTSVSSPIPFSRRSASPNESVATLHLSYAKMSQEERDSEALKEKELGNKCYHQHDYEEAVEHYTKAISLQPDNHLLFTNRASAYYRDEQLENALEDALKAIKLNSKWPKGYLRAGVILIQQGKHHEGLAILQESLTNCFGEGEEGEKGGKNYKDIEEAIELGEVFWEATKLGFSLRMAPVNGRIRENVFQNQELLRAQKFGELATAVTMTLSPTSTRCVRQAFVDQMGKIVSLESSVSDQTIISRLNSGDINQVYVFVVVSKEGKEITQKFSYKEPRPNSGESNFEIYPLSVLQLDVLDLTLTLLAREPSPNLFINKILK